jgi:uncharacterized protein (UPF0332 family)
VKPEVAAHLAVARSDLSDAKKLASLGFIKIAARCAYYAAFHAAEAYIFERNAKVTKTHSGVRAELARLLKGAPVVGEPLPAFLARSYRLKEISDYGKPGDVVTEAEVRGAIEGAERFVDRIVELMAN